MTDADLKDIPPRRKSTKQVWVCRKDDCDERQDVDIEIVAAWHEVRILGKKVMHKMDLIWKAGDDE